MNKNKRSFYIQIIKLKCILINIEKNRRKSAGGNRLVRNFPPIRGNFYQLWETSHQLGEISHQLGEIPYQFGEIFKISRGKLAWRIDL